MFHNIDQIVIALAAVCLCVAMVFLGHKAAREIQASLEAERDEDRVKLARATGMIDPNQIN
jgi:hypothetical protein